MAGVGRQLLELKYCERCGALGTRDRNSDRIYCEPCGRQMLQVYRAPAKRRAGDWPGKRVVEQVEEAAVLAGGRA